MAKSRKNASTRVENTAPPTAVPATTVFAFNAFHVMGVLFEQVPLVPLAQGEQAPTLGQDTQMGVQAVASIATDNIGLLRLAVTIVPNPRIQPYKISVDVQGTFSMVTGTREQLAEFCRVNAPMILFPYIRQIVDRITVDAPYGAVRLNPMNITQWLNQTPWKDAPVPTAETASALSSIAPAPPREQSGDASRE